jgi:hypothetical protein
MTANHHLHQPKAPFLSERLSRVPNTRCIRPGKYVM